MYSANDDFQSVILKVELNEQILWVEASYDMYKVYSLFDDAPVCLYENEDLDSSIKFLLKHCGKLFNIDVSFVSDDEHFDEVKNLLENYFSDAEVEEFANDEDFMRRTLTIFKSQRRKHIKEKKKNNQKLKE